MQQPLFPSSQMTSKSFIEMNKDLMKAKKKHVKKEEKLQLSFCKYVKAKHPDVIFQSDIASGMKLPAWIASKCTQFRSERAQPDFVAMEPRGRYFAIALELKNTLSDVYLADGVTISDCKSKQHVREQAEILKRLRNKGYFADFSFGIEDTIKKFDTYMAL